MYSFIGRWLENVFSLFFISKEALRFLSGVKVGDLFAVG
ncbi:hypothetical protein GGQ77_000206 [Geobacillus thermodenitrificans]|nr:hypothetical protein [Geobacillus thermodenitrificans]